MLSLAIAYSSSVTLQHQYSGGLSALYPRDGIGVAQLLQHVYIFAP